MRYGEYKLTNADKTVKTIGIKTTTIQTRLPKYNLTRKQLEHKDLSQPEVVKLRKIIRDLMELMNLRVKLQDANSKIKKRMRFIISTGIHYIYNFE